jgi:hypothetical protein
MIQPPKRDVDRAWNFDGSETNQVVLKPLCQRVESEFVFPPKRLWRYFAASHDEYLQQMNGEHYRVLRENSSENTFPPGSTIWR